MKWRSLYIRFARCRLVRIARSSITGRFVSREYAEAHPETTQVETLHVREKRNGHS